MPVMACCVGVWCVGGGVCISQLRQEQSRTSVFTYNYAVSQCKQKPLEMIAVHWNTQLGLLPISEGHCLGVNGNEFVLMLHTRLLIKFIKEPIM